MEASGLGTDEGLRNNGNNDPFQLPGSDEYKVVEDPPTAGPDPHVDLGPEGGDGSRGSPAPVEKRQSRWASWVSMEKEKVVPRSLWQSRGPQRTLGQRDGR